MAFLTAEVRGNDALTRELLQLGRMMPIAQMRAINRTLDGARTRAAKAIADDLKGAISQTAVRRSISLKRATPRDLVGELSIGPYLRDDGKQPHKLGRIPLFHFAPVQLPRGVAYSIGHRFLPGSFLVAMRSGHRAVAKRRHPSTHKAASRPGTARSWNLPIDERFGPSPRRVFRSRLIDAHVKEAQAQFESRLVHEIDAMLKGHAPGQAFEFPEAA